MGKKSPKMPIRKIDAAMRQIDVAISLLFDNRDMVSIHTLAAAGGTILHDIAGHKKVFRILDCVVEARQKEFMNAVRKAQNFFKHADKEPEPDKTFDFTPDLTWMMLFEACLNAIALQIPHSPERLAFLAVFMIENPELIRWDNAPGELRDAKTIADDVQFDPLDPMNFKLWKQVVEMRLRAQGTRPW